MLNLKIIVPQRQCTNCIWCMRYEHDEFHFIFYSCLSNFSTILRLSQITSDRDASYRPMGSCPVYTREISECYISCLTQDLEFIFCVPIRNTMIKNGQDYKRQMIFYLILWLCPFNIHVINCFLIVYFSLLQCDNRLYDYRIRPAIHEEF